MARGFWLFLLLLSCGLAACAKEKSTSTSSSSIPLGEINPPLAAPSAEMLSAQKFASNATLSCAGKDCNPSIALLTMVNHLDAGWSPFQCTASLVDSETAVTNGHCIPDDLTAPGSSCLGRIWLTFAPDSDHPAYESQMDCAQVLYAHHDAASDGSDYAYIKLAHPSQRPSLRISRDGIPDNTSFTVQKVNPVETAGGVAGTLETVSCKALSGSAIFDSPRLPDSTTNFFVDCDIVHGNSGSPIFGADGTLRGVIYAFVDKASMSSILAKQGGAAAPDPREINDLNLGSNFACLNAPNDPTGLALPASCSSSPSRSAAALAAFNSAESKELNAQAQALVVNNSTPALAAFQWGIDTGHADFFAPASVADSYLGTPSCALAPTSPAELAQRPSFTMAKAYDPYLRLTYTLSWAGLAAEMETVSSAAACGAL